MRLFRRKQFESEMDTELSFHMEAYVDDLVRSGLSRAEARRRARIEFGTIEATKDECRQAWGWQRMDEVRADLRLAFHTIRKNPGFASIAILSLALGIGANTAIVGLLDAVMLRQLPVRDPSGLVFVQTAGTAGRDGPPYPFFELLRKRATSFDALAAFSASNMEVVIGGSREQAQGVWVSGNFYQLLGIAPVLGRTLAASDNAAAVISRSYWQRRFGGDPAILGRTVHLFEHTVTIVGVMPAGTMSLEPGRPIDIAVPMVLSDPVKMRNRDSLWLDVVGRLRPGVPVERARSEANALFQGYVADLAISPEIHKMLFDHLELSPAAKGLGGLRGQFSQALTAMTILAGLVLLAACVNVANLMLARATAQQKDFAVRLAIGAGRGRLIRQTVTEAMVLVGAGASLGILFAQRGEAALAEFLSGGRDQIVLDLSMNGRLLVFTLAVSALTGLAFGILPALRAARIDPAAGMQGGSRSIAGSRVSHRLGRILVVMQVALSTVLLTGAGLFLHSLQQLESVNLGFAREGILTMEVTPERETFGTPQWSAAQAEILDRVRRLPGVISAGWTTMSPLSGRNRGAVLDVSGFVPRALKDKDVHLAAVSPDFFATFGVPLLLGRSFTEHDDASAPKAAIFNETAARFYFGSSNPIGKNVRFVNYPGHDLLYQIVGVVKDSKHDSLREQPSRFIYLPIPQSVDRINRLALAVRCAGDAARLAAPVRKEVQSVRSSFLVNNVYTIEKQIEQSLGRERLVTGLSSAFGALALALACIGLYGILAYAVTRRTHELGIRMALGATGGGMIWLVLGEALTLAGSGIAIGIPAALGLARITKALLYGVGAFDVPVLAVAVLLLLLWTAIAAVVPARRAGRLDPTAALRCE